jgi:putative lipoprotein
MRKVLLFAVLVCLAFAGCRKAADQPDAAPSGSTAPTTGEATIHGRAFYLERMLLPPDTVLDVQLIRDRRADTPETVIAQKRFSNLKGPPYDFELPFDRARLQPNASYSLQATFNSTDGHAEFATDTRVPVNPASTKVVQFRVVRVPGR